jgi:hypothetical protein
MNAIQYLACSTCRVSFESTGDSIGYSIFALLIVILAVLGAVGFFMIRIGRRESANLDPELRDDYVPR